MVSTIERCSRRKISQVRKIFFFCEHENCGCRKVRKHKEIKGSDKHVTVDISSKFDSLNKMKTTSSESKKKLERSGKGLITSLGFKTKSRSQKYKKASYAIGNVSEKDLLKIIKEFEKIWNYLMIKLSPNMSQLPATFI